MTWSAMLLRGAGTVKTNEMAIPVASTALEWAMNVVVGRVMCMVTSCVFMAPVQPMGPAKSRKKASLRAILYFAGPIGYDCLDNTQE